MREDEDADTVTQSPLPDHDALARLAHDLRSPLTGILGLSEVLAEEDVTPQEVRDFAARINGEARRLARLISDLLES